MQPKISVARKLRFIVVHVCIVVDATVWQASVNQSDHNSIILKRRNSTMGRYNATAKCTPTIRKSM